jgi:DNA-binding transcriptional regulator YiaG
VVKERQVRVQWETIFHGSRRKISTVIIGTEADFRSRKVVSREEAKRLLGSLKDYLNLSYHSGAAIAREIGVHEEALSGWLSGRVKPRSSSLLKVLKFLRKQPRTPGGIAPVGYVPRPASKPNGRRGTRRVGLCK